MIQSATAAQIAEVTTPYKNPRAVFEKAADLYDEGAENSRWVGPLLVVQNLRQYFQIAGKPIEVLDLGVGTGHVGKFLKEINPDARITGVDFSPNMLRNAVNAKRIDEAREGDISQLDWNGFGKYDLITLCGVADFIPPEATAGLTAGIARALKNNGGFGITFEQKGTTRPGHRSHQHETSALVAQFTNSGAQILKAEAVDEIFLHPKTGNPVENILLVGKREHGLN